MDEDHLQVQSPMIPLQTSYIPWREVSKIYDHLCPVESVYDPCMNHTPSLVATRSATVVLPNGLQATTLTRLVLTAEQRYHNSLRQLTL